MSPTLKSTFTVSFLLLQPVMVNPSTDVNNSKNKLSKVFIAKQEEMVNQINNDRENKVNNKKKNKKFKEEEKSDNSQNDDKQNEENFLE